ncbi:hypothetical protein DFH07DRAFT_946996 [Mycena maculata]|uniref:Uncharacterized protein n=1 Tax=Mycena maculata TaxID=230809 RepID=A0AAD7HI43_9AGAR|nr:hypothetical protein DFH07DRAFT_946996 [Mycena maculata]
MTRTRNRNTQREMGGHGREYAGTLPCRGLRGDKADNRARIIAVLCAVVRIIVVLAGRISGRIHRWQWYVPPAASCVKDAASLLGTHTQDVVGQTRRAAGEHIPGRALGRGKSLYEALAWAADQATWVVLGKLGLSAWMYIGLLSGICRGQEKGMDSPAMDTEYSEQDSFFHPDSTVLVATTLATLVLAGGAYICRSGRRLHSHSLSESSPDRNASQSTNDPKDPKTSAARSKERRRRGKDPLKEILKGGKKLKMLSVSRDDPGSTSASASTSALPSPLPQGHSISQRSPSLSTSGRSVSSSTASSAAHVGDAADGDATPAATSGRPPNADGEIDANVTASVSPSDSPDADPIHPLGEIPEIAVSTSVPTDSSSGSTSTAYGGPASGLASPWDWDGQGPKAGTSTVAGSTSYRKPPRFRSKSPALPIPYSTNFASASGSTSSSDPASPQQLSASSMSSDDVASPTLNTVPSSRPRTPMPSTATPLRTETSSPASPSLSAQTQLASLRGALEATRLREEQTRAELERVSKDAEVLRWEVGGWRRREGEMQAQIHHMMHQLQAYGALFAAQQAQHLQINSPGVGGSPVASPGAYPPPAGMYPPGMPPPFFGYPAPPLLGSPLHSPPPPPSQQHQPHPNQPNPNLFALLFPPSFPPSPSHHSPSAPVPALSSGSSGSPSSSGSGSPAPGMRERGRRRMRTQTAEARLGMGAGWDEGWVGVEVPSTPSPPFSSAEDAYDEHEDDGCGYDGEYEYGADGVSGALADAILKRPESIRVPRRNLKRDPERVAIVKGEEGEREFTFPSLSGFGVGIAGGGKGGTVAQEQKQGEEEQEHAHDDARDGEARVELQQEDERQADPNENENADPEPEHEHEHDDYGLIGFREITSRLLGEKLPFRVSCFVFVTDESIGGKINGSPMDPSTEEGWAFIGAASGRIWRNASVSDSVASCRAAGAGVNARVGRI